jgi:hypothetical protein
MHFAAITAYLCISAAGKRHGVIVPSLARALDALRAGAVPPPNQRIPQSELE